MPAIRLQSHQLSIEVNSFGAELRSLRHNDVEYLWDATDPWHYSAPVLFPIISGLPDSQLVHDGVAYPIASHGFARRTEWEIVGDDSMLLRSTDETRAHYPFEFSLVAKFSLTSTLSVSYTVTNDGATAMPFLIGAHPAFRWPLPGATPNADHEIRWQNGGDSMRQASNGLIPSREPAPVVDGRLVLRREQFALDALLFDDIEPRQVTYSAPGAARVTMTFDSFPRFGVWSKAEYGDFVCLEPWSGYPAPRGFTGEIGALPETTSLPSGESATFEYSITIEEK